MPLVNFKSWFSRQPSNNTESIDDNDTESIDDAISIPSKFDGFLSNRYKPPRLPTYLTSAEIESRFWLSSPGDPLLFVDAVKQIKEDYLKARLIIFEIAKQRSTWNVVRGTNKIKLSGPALLLDRAIASAEDTELGSFGRIGFYEEREKKIKNDPGLKTALDDLTRSIRKVEKSIRDDIIEPLERGMVDKHYPLDYKKLLERFTELYTQVLNASKVA